MDTIEKGFQLEGLVKEFLAIRTSTVNEWIPRGLMTREEFQAWNRANNLESQAEEVGHQAENTVSIPSVAYPPEYLALTQELNQVGEVKGRLDKAMSAFGAFIPHGGYESLYGNPENADIIAACKQANEYLARDEQRLAVQIERLLVAKNAKKRRGTHIGRLEEAYRKLWYERRDQAREEAEAAFLQNHVQEIAAGKAARSAMESRVQERQNAVLARIRSLLLEPVEARP